MKIYCHNCGKRTNHIIDREITRRAPPDTEHAWKETHYLAHCAGCDSITYATEEWSEDTYDPGTDEVQTIWKTYPYHEGTREGIANVYKLPAKVRMVYQEVLQAMNSQLGVLSGIGLRALIEAICKEEGIVGNDLKELIDGLATKGVLSPTQAAHLHSHRFLGNAAAHQAIIARPEELGAALDIAEIILRTIYIMPELGKAITTGRGKTTG